MGARLAGDVEPEIAGRGQLDRQHVVVARGPADQHDHAVRALGDPRHRASLPDPGIGIGRRWRVYRSCHVGIIAISALEGAMKQCGSEGAAVVIRHSPTRQPGRLPHNLTTVTRSHCGAAARPQCAGETPAPQTSQDLREMVEPCGGGAIFNIVGYTNSTLPGRYEPTMLKVAPLGKRALKGKLGQTEVNERTSLAPREARSDTCHVRQGWISQRRTSSTAHPAAGTATPQPHRDRRPCGARVPRAGGWGRVRRRRPKRSTVDVFPKHRSDSSWIIGHDARGAGIQQRARLRGIVDNPEVGADSEDPALL